jgi:hypothetical protein
MIQPKYTENTYLSIFPQTNPDKKVYKQKLIIEEPRILYVERTVTPKYVCPCCKGGRHDADALCVIKQTPAVPAILAGSITSPSMLAHIFTQAIL